jgi:hypothetical protein
MQRLLKSVWFPLLIGVGLSAAGIGVSPTSFGGTFLFALGMLVLTDAEFWQAGAFSATYFYEGREPEVDWWKITRDAYEPWHFYLRLLWLIPISLLIATAVMMNHPSLWIASGFAFCTYVVFLFVRFRHHIMDYMDSIGVRLKSFSTAGEARFDTRNPEERQ